MLTSDLVRGQVRAGVLRPRWVDLEKPATIDDATAVIERFALHVGQRVGLLDEAIDDLAASRTEVIFIRGLAKLCFDRSDLGVRELAREDGAVVTPAEIRHVVFRLAAEHWPVRPGAGVGFSDRGAVLTRAAEQLGLTAEAIEGGLYADRRSEQTLISFEAPTARELLDSYQMALAQGCLLRAREVRVAVHDDAKRVRALLRELKFRRLLFRAEAREDGLDLVLDGPLSLFKQTSRYGLQLALALPAIVRCARWSLEAVVGWGPARSEVTLRLDQKAPLVATGRDHGTWTGAEETHFEKAFAALESPWTLSREGAVLDLDGQDTLVPDFVATHPDGRKAFVDLVFAWRRDAFVKRMAVLAEAGPPHLVVVVADKGRLDRGDDAAAPMTRGPTVLSMKGVVPARKVLEAIERVAIREVAKASARTRSAGPASAKHAEGKVTKTKRAEPKGAEPKVAEPKVAKAKRAKRTKTQGEGEAPS